MCLKSRKRRQHHLQRGTQFRSTSRHLRRSRPFSSTNPAKTVPKSQDWWRRSGSRRRTSMGKGWGFFGFQTSSVQAAWRVRPIPWREPQRIPTGSEGNYYIHSIFPCEWPNAGKHLATVTVGFHWKPFVPHPLTPPAFPPIRSIPGSIWARSTYAPWRY